MTRTGWAPPYAEAGAASVTLHAEAAAISRDGGGDPVGRGQGGRGDQAGDSLSEVDDVLDAFDMLLVMTVEPGFGGQSFIAEMLAKVREARQVLDAAAWICGFRSTAA